MLLLIINIRSENMAEKNIGKITQIIGAVLDVKFSEGKLAGNQ